MAQQWLLSDLDVATLSDKSGGYGLFRDAAIGIEGDRIGWVGPKADIPEAWRDATRVPMEGRLVTPALIDCHTHIVHAGHRAREFELRLTGASYEEIARAGGGIVSTVTATRAAPENVLLQQALERVDTLISEGVAVIEVKSGYGLDRETELRMLRVARRLGEHRQIRVRTSFLGAHAIPDGLDADDYIDDVCLPTLMTAHADGLVDAVDGFCESIAFTPAQIARVFDAAAALGLPVKLHAEQLSHQGATALAAKYGALSADHLEYANEADATALARAGSVAVLLPGAYYTLRQMKAPPVAAFRDAGIPVAVATDWNPG
ncbi:MAG: imidazolonepropionase, partial [Pseudomonadota bacterium]